LATAAVWTLGKVTLGGKSLSAARATIGINIQKLQAQLVIVTIILAVSAINLIHGLFHLRHVLSGRGIQSFLNHGLLCAPLPTKRRLQSRVCSHPFVDLYQTVFSGQNGSGRKLAANLLVNDDRLVYGDRPHVLVVGNSFTGSPITLFWQALIGQHFAPILFAPQ
jgi:hypothetical protein